MLFAEGLKNYLQSKILICITNFNFHELHPEVLIKTIYERNILLDITLFYTIHI